MNAVQIAGYWVPAREPVRELPRLSRPYPAPPLTTLLRRRAAWGLAVALARRTPPARPS
ncbi:hypothetical protein [Streptomyces sp. NBC_00091]|uniref:hypothetical protein n=1 Tax=Streptomyces sp. NBC_00091 TaxID=2975648 RepID=UPI0022516961|nr:hypothetical protein [Streptomyces sp. NBC_00091]MCX5381203.1 hypothetical protein [Streptomyces sp. NBC_00091]